MFNLDPGKLLVIAIVAIILLGPDKLPQFARQVGGAWRSLNEFRHRMEAEVRNTMPDLPPTSELARLARSPSALLDHLSAMSTDEEQRPGQEEGQEEVPDGSFQAPVPADGSAHAVSGNGTVPRDATPPPVGSTDDSSDDSPPAAMTAPAPTPEPAPALVSEPAPVPTSEAAPEAMAPGDPTLN